jgi:hypothetical protein
MPTKSVTEAVGDLQRGLIVETGNVLATTCWEDTDSLTIFNVYGRILLLELFGTITVDMAGAAQPNFSYTGTTPAVAITDICAVSASIAALNAGHRVVWPGGTVAGTLLISGNEYLSPGATGVPFILGGVSSAGVNFIGTIQADGSVAAATAGAVIFTCAYVPMSDGAYVKNAV